MYSLRETSITALILCGGEGTRSRPVLGDIPKCLAPVSGKPFLSYICDHLYKQGIRDLVCCARSSDKPYWEKYRKEAFGSYRKKLSVCMMYEVTPKGTGYSLQTATKTLVHSTMTLVLNGDTYCPFSLNSLYYFHSELYTNPLTLLCDCDDISTGISIQGRMMLENLSEEELKDFRVCQSKGIKMRQCSFLDIGTSEGYSKAEDFLKERGTELGKGE